MFVLFDPQRPHLALQSSEALDTIAIELAARPDADLAVYVSEDGKSRELSRDERRRLGELLEQAPKPV